MIDTIKKAYHELYRIYREETDLQRHITKKLVVEHMNEIQTLSEIILNRENFDADDEHVLICQEWSSVIGDVLMGIEQEDEVLLLDAVGHGILPFVRSLLPEEEWEE